MTVLSKLGRHLAGLTLTAGLLLAVPTLAQDEGEGPGSTGPQPGAPTAVPLDGGASLLLASGVAYGLRKLQKRRAR